LHNRYRQYSLDDLNQVLADLRYKRVSIAEIGEIPEIRDDIKFEKQNPEHPLAASNRFRRQGAAEFFLCLAEESPDLITKDILNELHISLFDCDAAVRFDIAKALGFLNRAESIEPLRRIIEEEPESKMVRQMAELAYSGHKKSIYGKNTLTLSGLSEKESGESTIREELTSSLMKISSSNCFYILFAALAWENTVGILTERGWKNLSVLRSPGFTYSVDGGNEQWRLSSSTKRVFLQDFRARISRYYENPIDASTLTERIDGVICEFRLIGYEVNYAGNEGSIRQRLFAGIGKEWSKDIEISDLSNERIRLLAAYYLAYTDYQVYGVPSNLLRDDVQKNTQVFISHSGKDADFASRLGEDLANHGFNVWLDAWELRFGDSLWDKIGEGLSDSTFLLIVLSPRSVKSPWVRRELNAGLSLEIERGQKIVIPILFENAPIPTFLKEKFYCDLSEDYDAQFARLVKSLE